MEWKIVLNRRRGLDRIDFESGTDVGKGARTEGKRFGVMSLPSLVLSAKVECPRVLEVRGKDNRFVSGLSGQLNTEIPGVQGHKGKFQVLIQEVLLSEGVEAADCIAEAAC